MASEEPASRFDQVWNHLCAIAFATLALGTLFGVSRPVRERPRIDVDAANGKLLEDLVTQFRIDCGRYPSASEGLEVLRIEPADLVDRWRGPYLEAAIPTDRFGRPYHYAPSPGGFRLLSLGANGKAGGVGLDEDRVVGSSSDNVDALVGGDPDPGVG